MRGTLNAAPLLELLSALRRFRKSGSLLCEAASMSLSVIIEHGAVRSVSTSDPSLRIGQVLIQLGLTTEEHIEQALALQTVALDPERIGDVLVDVGFIPETAIGQAIGAQISSSLMVMFNDEERTLTFRQTEPETTPEQPLHPASDPLILTAAFLSEYWLDNADYSHPDNRASSPATLSGHATAAEKLRRRFRFVLDRINKKPDLVSLEQPRVVRSLNYLVDYLERVSPRVPHHEDLHPTVTQTATRPGSARCLDLIDREIDIWQLADLTRGARAGLLELINGEQNQTTIEEVIGEIDSSPERAIMELIERKLIHQPYASPSRPEQPEQAPSPTNSGDQDRTLTMRFYR